MELKKKLGTTDPAVYSFVCNSAKVWGGPHQPLRPFVLLWFLFCMYVVDLIFFHFS